MEPINATDAAIELAEDYGIDISTVEGTGEGGRILKGDVQAFAEAEGYVDAHTQEDPEDTEGFPDVKADKVYRVGLTESARVPGPGLAVIGPDGEGLKVSKRHDVTLTGLQARKVFAALADRGNDGDSVRLMEAPKEQPPAPRQVVTGTDVRAAKPVAADPNDSKRQAEADSKD